MKLAYVQAEGFRGFRNRIRVDIPPGFAILVGPNGVGKSSVCDAVEFALTGTIRGTSTHSERREHIDDYLWWRGARQVAPDDRHVEIGLLLPDGHPVTIRRTRTGLTVDPDVPLEKLLFRSGSLLHNPLQRLCQTAILRDEDITTLSVDLGETRRFEFVRDALGAADFQPFSRRAQALKDRLKRHHGAAAAERDRHQASIVDLTRRLSEVRARAAEGRDLADAEALLTKHVPHPVADAADLLAKAQRSVAANRHRLDGLRSLYGRLVEISSRLQEITTQDHLMLVDRLESSLENALAAAERASEDSSRYRAQLDDIQAVAPRNASLALLVEHGGLLGLDHGECPLCGATQTEEDFRRRLTHLREASATADTQLSALSKESTDAARGLAEATRTVEQARVQLARVKGAEHILRLELAQLLKDAHSLDPTISEDAPLSADRLAQRIHILQSESAEIEKALGFMIGSHAAAQVLELEREVASARQQLVVAEGELLRAGRALGRADEAIRTIKRVQGELVDEQLAALSPLFIELYERLRPHVDWRSVRYRLRGDVRKMLSLDVGAGLNPSFIFSSGQRRAAGLAFLVAIFLSRGWCKLNALILDDPVQHIDDYRALHLTEVLAAVKRTGYQIICTVEDSALAELLGRRLRGDAEDWGAIVKLRYEPSDGAKVEETRRLAPFAPRVLVAS